VALEDGWISPRYGLREAAPVVSEVAVGDRARFMGHIYRALQMHQATPGTEPNVATNLWELVQ